MKHSFKNGDLLRYIQKVDKEGKVPYYCIVIDAFDEWMNVFWIICGEHKSFHQSVDINGYYGTYQKVA